MSISENCISHLIEIINMSDSVKRRFNKPVNFNFEVIRTDQQLATRTTVWYNSMFKCDY